MFTNNTHLSYHDCKQTKQTSFYLLWERERRDHNNNNDNDNK